MDNLYGVGGGLTMINLVDEFKKGVKQHRKMIEGFVKAVRTNYWED